MEGGDDTIRLMSMLRSMKRSNENSRKSDSRGSVQTSGKDQWNHLLQCEVFCSVSACPDADLVGTNVVYISVNDYTKRSPDEDPKVFIGNSVYSVCYHAGVQLGCVALEQVQRINEKLSLNDTVRLRMVHSKSYFPVCSEIFVEVSAIQEDGYHVNTARIEYDELTNQIMDTFCGQVFHQGQSALIISDDMSLKMKVNSFSTNFEDLILSFCLGKHKRLGVDSWLQALDNHIVQYIAQLLIRDAFFFPQYVILDRSTILNIELRTDFTFLNSISKELSDERFFSYNSHEQSTFEMQMIEDSCQFLNEEGFSTVEVNNEARFENCLGLLVVSKTKQRKSAMFWRWKLLCKESRRQGKDFVIARLYLRRGNMRRKIIFFSRWASWIAVLQKTQSMLYKSYFYRLREILVRWEQFVLFVKMKLCFDMKCRSRRTVRMLIVVLVAFKEHKIQARNVSHKWEMLSLWLLMGRHFVVIRSRRHLVGPRNDTHEVATDSIISIRQELTPSSRTGGVKSNSSDGSTPNRNKSLAHAIQDATISLQELFTEETSCSGLDSYYIRQTPDSFQGNPWSSASNGSGGRDSNNKPDDNKGNRPRISDELNSSTSCLSTKRLLVMLREELDEG